MYVSETELSKTINALVRSTRYLLLVVRYSLFVSTTVAARHSESIYDNQSNRGRFGEVRL